MSVIGILRQLPRSFWFADKTELVYLLCQRRG